MQTNKYEIGLDKNDANYVPLSPLTFVERTASIFPNRLSLVHGAERYTWKETYARCSRLASALVKRGIRKGDTVAVMMPNTPQHFEAHFGVPVTGAVLNSINLRQDAETIAFILQHAEAKVLLTDREFSDVIEKALQMLPHKPIVIDIDDPQARGGKLIGEMTYEDFLKTGDENFAWKGPDDEWDAISLNYTSGHHRQSQRCCLPSSRRLPKRHW